jgi:hypothetical protein
MDGASVEKAMYGYFSAALGPAQASFLKKMWTGITGII